MAREELEIDDIAFARLGATKRSLLARIRVMTHLGEPLRQMSGHDSGIAFGRHNQRGVCSASPARPPAGS